MRLLGIKARIQDILRAKSIDGSVSFDVEPNDLDHGLLAVVRRLECSDSRDDDYSRRCATAFLGALQKLQTYEAQLEGLRAAFNEAPDDLRYIAESCNSFAETGDDEFGLERAFCNFVVGLYPEVVHALLGRFRESRTLALSPEVVSVVIASCRETLKSQGDSPACVELCELISLPSVEFFEELVQLAKFAVSTSKEDTDYSVRWRSVLTNQATQLIDSSDSSTLTQRMIGEILAKHGFSYESRLFIAPILESESDKELDALYLQQFPSGTSPWQIADAMKEMYPRHAEDYRWLYDYAKVLHEAQRFGEAALAFEESYKILGGGPWRIYRAGLAWQLAGNDLKADKAYRSAIRDDVKLGADKWGLGALHDEMSRFEAHWDFAADAYRVSAEATQSAGMRASLYARAGEAYGKALDFNGAKEAYLHALELRPTRFDWLEELATAFEHLGDYVTGADYLAAILTAVQLKDTDRAELSRRIGWLYYRAGRFEKAVRFLLLSVNVDPQQLESEAPDSDSDLFAGGRGLHGGDVDGELVSFSSMTDRIGHLQRARLYERLGRKEVALRDWRMALMFGAPSSEEVAIPAAKAFYEAGEWELACRSILSLRLFNSGVPRGVDRPKERSYAERLAAYVEWRETLPVDKDVILWESNFGASADCNPLYLFREVVKNHPGEYIHVWSMKVDVPVPREILECSDAIVVPINGRLHTRLLATAGFLVNNSTFSPMFTRRRDQRYLMTWHGTPLKTLGKAIPGAPQHFNIARNLLQATYVIFPNDHTKFALVDGCDVQGLLCGKVEISGYPRNDGLLRSKMRGVSNVKKKVLFAPTHREGVSSASEIADLVRVKDLLEERGYEVLMRAHHYVEEKAISINPTLPFVPRTIPTYDLLEDIDLLITDFSSIYSDFALTERPIIHFVPDWEEYASTRGVYFGKERLPGIVCESWEEFISAIENPGVDLAKYREFNAEFSPYDDGSVAARVAEEFLASATSEFRGNAHPEFVFRQSLVPNGMSSAFVNLANELASQGHDLTVLTEGSALLNDAPRLQVAEKLPQNARLIGRVGRAPRSIVELHAAEVSQHLHSHSPSLRAISSGFYRREALRVLPVGFKHAVEYDGYSPFYSSLILALDDETTKSTFLHSDISEEILTRLPMLKGQVRLLPEFDHVIAVTPELMKANAEKLHETFRITTRNFTWARNLVLEQVVRSKAAEPVPPDLVDFIRGASSLLVQVGRLSVEKNHALVLRALYRAIEAGSDARLLIVGDGPLRSELEALVSELGINHAVAFSGYLNNPYPVMAAADTLLLSSLYEGQPIVIMEARILGLSVIASEIPATKRLESYFGDSIRLLPFEESAWAEALCNHTSLSQDVWESSSYCHEALDEFYAAIGEVAFNSSDSSFNLC